MIYLIGGPPKCGKTTLAKKLAKTLGIPWVSTDTLQLVIKPYISENEYILKFPTSLQRCESNDEKYFKFSTTEIIEAYKKQSKTIYDAVDMFVVGEITDGNDFIIEGYHIEPELVNILNLKYPNKIKNVFIIKSDKQKFINDIKKSSTPNDWIINRTNNEETFGKIANMICEYGKFFEDESKKYDFKTFNMDNDFENQLDEAIKYLI